MRKIHLSWKDLFFNLALALLYFGVAKMGLLFGFSKEPILSHWSLSGLALAALLIWGYRLTPAVFLGALATYLSAGVPWGSALLIGVGETLEAVIAFYCLRRTRFDRRMSRLRDLWLLITFGVLLGPLIATTVSVTAFALSGLTLPASSSVWWTWWLSDAGSVLVLTPPLLMVVLNQRQTRGERIETAGVLLFLLASSVLVFWDPFPKIIPLVSWGYLVFPALLYSGLRTGMYGAALSVSLLSISAAIATALGLGPIARYEPDLNLWQLDIYMGVAAITAYGFALAVDERRQTEEKLKESEQRYSLLFSKSAVPTVLLKLPEFIITDVNEAVEKLLGFTKQEMLDKTAMEMDIIPPEALAQFIKNFEKQGSLSGSEMHIRTKSDGERFVIANTYPLEIRGQRYALATMQDITERKRAEEKLHNLLEERKTHIEELQNQRQALEAAQHRYEELFEFAPDGYLVTNSAGIIEHANRAAVAMLGTPWLDLIGKPLAVYLIKDDRQRREFYAHLTNLKKGQQNTQQWEAMLKPQGGQPAFPAAITIAPAYDSQGVLTGIRWSLRDITERKQAEKALIENEKIFRLIANNSPDIIFSQNVDLIYDRIINPAPPLTPEDVVGKTDFDLLPQPQAQLLTELKRKVITTGEGIHEELLLSPGGIQRWYDVVYNPVYDENGQIVGIISYSRDITERKRAEEALRRSEALLLQTGKMAKVGGWELDLQTMTLSWSAETYRIHEVDPSLKPDLENAINFYAPEARPIITEAVRQAVEEGKAYDLELPFITAKGNRIWIRTMGEAEFQNGKCVRLFGTFQDITERKRLDADRLARELAERASQAKSEFLSRMSHELRTPLNSILGFAQLLEMDKLNPDQSENVHQIIKSGRHLLDLVNEVLDIARIEAGRLTTSPEPVHVETAVREALELIRPLADQRGISIQVKVPSAENVFVTADVQRLKQVLLNLLSNAVKFNRPGGEIHITASLLVDGFLHLAVHDTGEGIPPDKMDRLFIPFERLKLDPERVEGTGLGLALSKGLVEAMGGRMGAQSVLGEGSTFWFDLPLTSEQKEVVLMAEVDDYLKITPSSSNGLILYVEDNLSNVKLVEKIIARLPGVELLTAMQGRLTLDLARANHPALILLDIHLPDIGGGEVLRALRADPQTADIPVVVMSADATHAQIERMLAAGANAYLTKPIDVRQFLDVVGRILGS